MPAATRFSSDAIRRAAARFRDRQALVVGSMTATWTFAGHRHRRHPRRPPPDPDLRPATRRPPRRLRPAILDAYLIAFLACHAVCRRGCTSPSTYALTGGELRYILEQSGARALLTAPALEANLDGITVEIRGRFDGGGDLDILATALDPAAATGTEPPIDDASLAQIVYTSGTTARRPGGADDDAPRECCRKYTTPSSTKWTFPRTTAP